jgi:ribosome-associated protein
LDSETLARTIARIAWSKKATEIIRMDMKDLSIVCDYFVVASGRTRIQTRAIAREIDEKLKEMGITKKKRIQGLMHGAWILIDYGDVLAHIFIDAERRYYDLEGCWKEAPIHYYAEEELAGA